MKFLDIYGNLKNKTIKKEILTPYKEITSLEGSPKKALKNFDCSYNKLTSLEYSPKEIIGDFNCSCNNITSLKGSPEKITGNFNVIFNNITSLKDCCKNIGEAFYCENNIELKNVKQQIIENQIKAKEYCTDEGHFLFENIIDDFNEYGLYLKKIELKSKIKEQNILKQKQIKINKIKLNKNDYGLSI